MMRAVAIVCLLSLTGCMHNGPAGHTDDRAGASTGDEQSLLPDSTAASFTGRVYDFGDVEERNGVVSHRFAFRNNGPDPVVVTQVRTSCQCVGAEFTRTPVLPGQESEVVVSYDPYGRPGAFSKEIRVLFNGAACSRSIWIRGRVIPFLHPIGEDHPYDLGHGLHANLKRLLLGGIAPGAERSIVLRYGNATQRPMSLRFVVEGDTRTCIELPDTVLLQADERRQMRIAYRMPEGLLGAQQLRIHIEVDGVRLPQPLALTAVAVPAARPATSTSPKMRCAQSNFLFGRSFRPQPFDLRIANAGKEPLRILSVDAPPGIATDLKEGVAIAPDASVVFPSVLSIPASGKGEYHDCIYIVSNDPIRPYITINLNTEN